MFEDLELNALITEFSSEFEGFNDKEILSIESRYGIRLPVTVKEYFRLMCKDSGDVFSGLEVEFSEIDVINDTAQQILKDNNRLDENPIFAFMMNQGYAFYAIKNFESTDPEVYSYIDGDDDLEIKNRMEVFQSS